ncbi:MAG: diguanylate cyclase [Rhizobacter sp.]|nr:diguanylate cyclase [Rhizobacter sp.]
MNAPPSSTLQRLAHIERLVDAIDLPMARWDRLARLVFCNMPYLHWTGRTREQLLGSTLQELFGEEAWQIAQPAFVQAFEGRTVNYERRLTHNGQSGRWARIQVFPDADGHGEVESVFTIAFDIHQDVVEREALAAARQRLTHFTENIPYPLTYVDRHFVLQFVNKAYIEATGQPPTHMLGKPIGDVRGAKRWEEHRAYFERALEGKTVQYTRLVNLATQGPRWVRTSYVPDFDADGAVVGLYTVTVDVHDLTLSQENLKRSVERDPLTDVLSRRAMMDRLDAALANVKETPVALFFVDLDGFKAVNDRLGHRAGDALLVGVAQALQSAVRAEDSVARFGGDEFLVLAALRDETGAHALALHMLDAVRSVTAQPVSASIGYALAPSDADQPLKLLQLADEAMYEAKHRGKNCVVHGGASLAPQAISSE